MACTENFFRTLNKEQAEQIKKHFKMLGTLILLAFYGIVLYFHQILGVGLLIMCLILVERNIFYQINGGTMARKLAFRLISL